MSQTIRYPKFGIPVRIAMSDRTQIIGVVFVRQNQRITEMLCDERTFFPIETTGGVRLLNKQHVSQIDLMALEEILEKRDLFPDIDVQYLSQSSW